MRSESRHQGRVRKLANGLLLTALIALGNRANAAESEAPFLWQVKGSKATHYLLGSVHLLPNAARRLPEGIIQAYRSADVLVFESDVTALQSRKLNEQMLTAAQAPKGIAAEIDAGTLRRLRARMRALRMPATQCESYRPWFCALSLELYAYQRAGFSGEYGLDRRLHDAAEADGRSIAWFEAPATHIGLFTDMAKPLSVQFLDAALADSGLKAEEPVEMYRAWRDNDSSRIEALIAEMKRDYPAVYEHLLARRNRAWLPELKRRLKLPERQLIVVGAAHWLGPDGLIASLTAAGYRIQPYLPITIDQQARSDDGSGTSTDASHALQPDVVLARR